MKWELDDNARGAFHYLLLGAVVMSALVGLNAALDLFHARIGPGGAFDHGYLIPDDGTRLISSDHTRGERLIGGLFVSVLAAIGAAAFVMVSCRLVRLGPRRPTLFVARAVFVVAVVYTSYAALFLPVHEFIGHRDRNLILWERNALFGLVPCPGPKRIVLVPFEQVTGLRVTQEPLADGRARPLIVCSLLNGDSLPLADGAAGSAGDTAGLRFAEERVSILRRTIFGP